MNFIDSTTNSDFSKIVFTFGNPNFASAFSAMLFAYILAQLVFSNGKRLFAVICCLTACLIAVFFFTILTDSIQGIVIVGICAALYSVVKIYIRWGKKSLTKILLPALAILIALSTNVVRSLHLGDSFAYRIEMWSTALRVYLDFPWFGVGAGNFRFFYPEYSLSNLKDGFGNRVISDDPHSWILNGLVSWGTLPIILILFLKLYVLWLCFREFKVIRGTDYFTQFISYLGAWLSLELSFLISPWNSTLSLWSSFLMGLLLSVLFGSSNDHHRTAKQKVRYSKFIRISLLSFSGFISLKMTTQFASDILKYEAFMRTNPSNLLSFNQNEVNLSSGFKKYREDAKILVYNSPYIGVNRKIAIAKRYESTGNLEFAASLHERILVENPRAFDSLYSLANISEILGNDEKAKDYLVSAEKIFPKTSG